MSNPFAPPQAEVADPAFDDIDQLPVSETWKKRFKWLKKAGGPGMPYLKNLSKEERKSCGVFCHFNPLAYLFGPFYYFAKGMWRRGIILFLICFSVLFSLALLLILMGFEKFAEVLGYAAPVIFTIRANTDYYKKMVLGDDGWW